MALMRILRWVIAAAYIVLVTRGRLSSSLGAVGVHWVDFEGREERRMES